MNIPKNISASSNAFRILKTSTDNVGNSIQQLGNQFALLNSKQQAAILVKIQTSVADEKQRIALTDQYLALTKLDEKEKDNIRTKLLKINVKNQNATAAQKETTEITKSLDKQLAQSGTKQGMSTGMAIGSAVIAGVMTAMSGYSSGKQAKDEADAVGSSLGNALTGGLSGAVTGAMLSSVIPGIGTAIGATVGAIGGVAISAVSTTVGYISEEGQRAVDKANALLDEYNQRISSTKSNLSTLESLKDEFNKLSRGVSDYGETIIFAPIVWKHAMRTALNPVTPKAA